MSIKLWNDSYQRGIESYHTIVNYKDLLRSSCLDPFFFVGDQSAHKVEEGFVSGTTTERVLSAMKSVMSSFSSRFPDILILSSFGNNDLPGDYNIPDRNSSFYQKVLEIWAPTILCEKCSLKVTSSGELNKTFLDGGYYRAEISGKFCVGTW